MYTIRMYVMIQLLCMLLFVLGIAIQQGLCVAATDAKNLRTQLFVTDGYDTKVRPSNNQSDPIGTSHSSTKLSVAKL